MRNYDKELVDSGVLWPGFSSEESDIQGPNHTIRVALWRSIAWLAEDKFWSELCEAVRDLDSRQIREALAEFGKIEDHVEDVFDYILEHAKENIEEFETRGIFEEK